MPDDSPLVLAIDTSTEFTGLALYDGVLLSEFTWRAGRNQTVNLLSQIVHLLGMNGLDLAALKAIGVATGPGMFNGLRVGLSTAKGLCFGLGIPIVGVSTLEAAAYPFRESSMAIRAFVPAGRGRAVFADFQNRNGRWMRTGDMQNRRFDELHIGIAESTKLVGEVPSDVSVTSIVESSLRLPSLALRSRRPSSIAEIAFQRVLADSTDDLAAIEPLYVHGSQTST